LNALLLRALMPNRLHSVPVSDWQVVAAVDFDLPDCGHGAFG
jgi:hypothetical protein